MARPDYQGNWRGARRYRFDVETRKKKAVFQRSVGLFPSIKRTIKSLPAFPLAILLIGAAGVGYTSTDMPLDRLAAMLPGSGCNIKGNVSFETGERIYHVPGQEYYRQTIISTGKGERWFCSEAEARQAGWRKAMSGSFSRGHQGPLILGP